jgi:hypothetical protein
MVCSIVESAAARISADGLGAIVIRIGQWRGEDCPLHVKGLVQQPCQLFAGGHGVPRRDGRMGLQIGPPVLRSARIGAARVRIPDLRREEFKEAIGSARRRRR